MIDKASLAQRSASATIDSGDDFSHQSTQAKDNKTTHYQYQYQYQLLLFLSTINYNYDYDNFDQTIMGLEVSQTQGTVPR